MTNANITWILLRGLMREHRHWGKFNKQLHESFPESQIITPDLPGSGVHYKTLSPISIDAIMRSVRAEIVSSDRYSKLEAENNKTFLLGLSLGAMVAVQWAKRYPQELNGAVLMNTSLRGVNPFFHRLRPVNYPSIIRNLFLSNDIKRHEQMILDLTSNKHADDDALLQSWIGYAKESGMTRNNVLRQLLAASRYTAPATKPDIPLLLLNGLGDRLVNPKCSQKIAQQWQTQLITHPNAGHDLSLDAGEWVCEQLVEWLAKILKNPGGVFSYP